MFEAEAYMEVKNIIRRLYKSGEWFTLNSKIKKVYKDNLDYWRLRLGYPDADIENQNSKSNANNSGQTKKPRRKKYYDHYCSLDQAYEEGRYEPTDPLLLEEHITQQETTQELHMAIDMLDDTDKSIIEMYYFEEMKEREIGQKLDIAQKTVNNHKRDSLEEIKINLEKMQ